MSAESTVVQKLIEGLVTSAKRDKTVAVSVERKRPHPQYGGKMVKNTTVYHVHDENNLAKEGDKVRIKESRPYSKTKSWVLVEVLSA